MGIIADKVESNWERNYDEFGIAGGREFLRHHTQPFLNICSSYRQAKKHHDELNRDVPLSEREKASFLVHQELESIKKQLISEAIILMQFRIRCIIRERIICQLNLSITPSSIVIADIVNAVSNCISETKKAINALLDDLDKDVYMCALKKVEEYDNENNEGQIIADSILMQAYQYMSNASQIIDRSSFRLLEKDYVRIIQFAYGTSFGTQKFDVMTTYLKNHFGVKERDVLCPACRKPMYSNIANCLNCYERR